MGDELIDRLLVAIFFLILAALMAAVVFYDLRF